MNAARKKQINVALEHVGVTRDILEQVCADESDAYYNLPDSLQESERGEKMYEGIDLLENAVGSIEEIANDMEEVIG